MADQGVAASARTATALRLPKLRQELRLTRGPTEPSGAPTWLIRDPVRHRFFSIDEPTYELLALLQEVETFEALMPAAATRLGREVSRAEIERLLHFLEQSQLCTEGLQGDSRNLHRLSTSQSAPFWQRTLGRFLSFRVTLFYPQRFLVATLPLLSFIFSALFIRFTILVGVVGLYFVSRQWDRFVEGLPDAIDWYWAASFSLAMIFVKVLHELGHAYTAVRMGCHVSSMGVIFIVFAPMPYTDVTDAWRLVDRRQRLMIDSAGIAAELIVACYATVVWAFLPAGPASSIAFVLAATSWTTSLLVNLNPLMRFDGYYILCELLKMDSLQSRAMAMGLWRLREMMFALGQPPPEQLSRSAMRFLCLFACALFAWRMLMAVSIAGALYHFAFKLVGIGLFLGSVVLLIIRPVISEIKSWSKMSADIGSSARSYISGAILFSLILLCFAPIRTKVTAPAIVEISDIRPLHVPRPALIRTVHVAAGERVRAGQALIELSSDELTAQLRLTQTRLALVEAQIRRSAADAQDRSASLVLDEERLSILAQVQGITAMQDDLVLRSPVDGMVLELDAGIQPGRFVAPSEQLILIGQPDRLAASGYIMVDDVGRIARGTNGWFSAEDPRLPAWPVAVDRIGVGGAQFIELTALTSLFDGPISVAADAKGRLVPVEGQVLVKFGVSPGWAPNTSVRGTVHLNAQPQSLAGKIWRRIVRVLLQEGGA